VAVLSQVRPSPPVLLIRLHTSRPMCPCCGQRLRWCCLRCCSCLIIRTQATEDRAWHQGRNMSVAHGPLTVNSRLQFTGERNSPPSICDHIYVLYTSGTIFKVRRPTRSRKDFPRPALQPVHFEMLHRVGIEPSRLAGPDR
jgi:hypothetical protein